MSGSAVSFPLLEKKTVFVGEGGKMFTKADAKAAKESKTSVQAMADGKLQWFEPFNPNAVPNRDTIPAATPAAGGSL